MAALVGTQALYLVLWIIGGVLWGGAPRVLPRLAAGPSLAGLQGRWTREDGQVSEVRGALLCPVVEPEERACSRLERDERGRLFFLMDDVWLPLEVHRRWGREVLTVEPSDLTFSRPISSR